MFSQILIMLHFIVLTITVGNVELLTIDNSKSNDFPIEELNNHTLREVFENRNIGMLNLTNAIYLGDGIYRLYNLNGITLDYDINNGIYTLNGETPTLSSSIYILRFLSLNIESQSTYSYVFTSGVSFGDSTPLRSFHEHLGSSETYWSLNPYNTNVSVVKNNVINWTIYLQSGLIYKFDNLKFKLQIESGSMVTPYQVPTNGPYNIFDLSTLNLTTEQINDWFSVYQENSEREISDTYDYFENEMTINDLIYIVLFTVLWYYVLRMIRGLLS